MSRVVEMHYTATQVSLLIGKSAPFVKDEIKRGKFGTDVFCVGGEYVLPASVVNAYMDKHRVSFPDGIAARTEGEYRRKAEREPVSA